MKYMKLIVLAVFFMIFSVGCTSNTESPEELTMMPVYDETKSDLFENINRLLVNSYLILPANSKEVGKINQVDLNSDGIKEIVVFEKKKTVSEEDQSEVGFLVLQEEVNSRGEQVYKDKGDILLEGDSIEYANFYDLDDDGLKEIVISVKNSFKTDLHIFKFSEDGIENIYTLDANWLPDTESYNNFKVKIGYIDEDPKLDILLLHFDLKTNMLYVSIANFKDKLILNDFVKIENVKDLSGLHITLGNISTSKRGVILDIPTAKENYYMTQILYVEENKLIKAFKDDDRNMMKDYYIPVDDINKDKVIEIPIVKGNGLGHAYISRTSSLVSWYKWNGKSGDESGILFNSQIYYNYTYNFKMFIQNNMANKIIVQRANTTENVSYNFNIYDQRSLDKKTLFTISIMPKTLADDSKTMNVKTGTTLAETEEYSYILHVNDIEELKRLDVTTDNLVEYFSFIY